MADGLFDTQPVPRPALLRVLHCRYKLQQGLECRPDTIEPIIVFTHVSDDNTLQAFSAHRLQQAGSLAVIQMPPVATHSLFEGVGIRPLGQHLQIVIGFQQ